MNAAPGAKTNGTKTPRSHALVSRAHLHERAAVFRLLQSDHRYVLTALHECQTLRAGGDRALLHTLALQACEDIKRHTEMDARELHRYLCGALRPDTLERRQEMEAKIQHLLQELRRWTRSSDPDGRRRFQELGRLFCQHVKLEEGLIFHQLAHTHLDWLQLHGALLQCREELNNATIVVGGNSVYS